jgi:hypothetical protein
MNSTFIVMIENSKKNQMFIKIVTGAKKKINQQMLNLNYVQGTVEEY